MRGQLGMSAQTCTFVLFVHHAAVHFQNDFHRELKEHKEDEDPHGIIQSHQLRPSSLKSQSDENGRYGEDVSHRAEKPMEPIEPRTILVFWSAATQRQQGVQHGQDGYDNPKNGMRLVWESDQIWIAAHHHEDDDKRHDCEQETGEHECAMHLEPNFVSAKFSFRPHGLKIASEQSANGGAADPRQQHETGVQLRPRTARRNLAHARLFQVLSLRAHHLAQVVIP